LDGTDEKFREGTRQLERPTPRCEDNIRMDVKEIELEGVKWFHLA
jgi:hypothetical protein